VYSSIIRIIRNDTSGSERPLLNELVGTLHHAPAALGHRGNLQVLDDMASWFLTRIMIALCTVSSRDAARR
jgi:hypothetical protein